MKLSAILENDENIVMVPLIWILREQRQKYLRDGYEVIPIPGYQETDGWRAFKIIGKYSNELYWIRNLSIPIWEDWKLTAKYAFNIEKSETTTGIQMFDRLDDDEKIQALKCGWYINTRDYIVKYFREHPELFERARHSLKPKEIHNDFEDLFIK